MGYTLKFEHPQFPADQEFSFNGLGLVTNGGTLEVDEDREREYVALSGRSLEDAFSSTAGATLDGSSSLSEEELTALLPPPEETESESGSEPSVDSAPNSAPSSPSVDEQATVIMPPPADGGEVNA